MIKPKHNKAGGKATVNWAPPDPADAKCPCGYPECASRNTEVRSTRGCYRIVYCRDCGRYTHAYQSEPKDAV